MIKNKYFLLLTFFIIFLFWSCSIVDALEVNLGLGPTPSLPEYVSFIFTWAISIAGALALISFAIGAVGLIVSGDNPTLAGNSKDRMKGAVLGLVLTLASFVIITTINPAIKTLTLTPLAEIPPAPPTGPIPGILYYFSANCKGPSSSAITSSEDVISDVFSGKIASVEIVNDPKNGIYYGAIFHKTPGLENGGDCNYPITGTGSNTTCRKLEDPSSSGAVDIFTINAAHTSSSGDGVDFYSDPFGWNTGANAVFFPVSDQDISSLTSVGGNYYNIKANLMKFDYTKINVLADPYKRLTCPTFQDCTGSIKIKGSYLVGLYSIGTTNKAYCQTFNKDVENLNAQPFKASSVKKLDKVYIIPTK